MTNPIQPVAWLREQRGEYEGPETLAPLLLLGHCEVTPHSKSHGATYEPLYGAAELDALRAELAREKQESARLRTALQKIADWDSSWGPFPENNAAWRAMVVVTAREAVPDNAATGG